MISKKQVATEIKVNPIPDNTVILTYLDRDNINLDPEYQRQSDVWSLEKKQLLIDSVINRFDIPKFYLHEYEKPTTIDGKIYKYALIDGKQRLTAIWAFINNEFPLSDDIEYLQEPTKDLRGLTYSELSKEHPRISAYFDGRPLSLMGVRTDDIELIEEMFSRLNEAMPLNAPEKRNAFGGPIPPIIRNMVKDKFFTNNLPFSNKRYRHLDLACKFLYLSDSGDAEDTKKIYLDLFVKYFKESKLTKKANELKEMSKQITEAMAKVFTKNDSLLKNVGLIVVYYLLFQNAIKLGKTSIITRAKFNKFEEERRRNREIAQEDIANADYLLLRFEELTNSPNDKFAIKYKYDVFCKYVFPELTTEDNFFRQIGVHTSKVPA